MRRKKLLARGLLAAAVSCVLLPASVKGGTSYINFGPADAVAIDQLHAWTFGFTDPGTDNFVGPVSFDGVLDTGANGVVLAATCFVDDNGNVNPNMYTIRQMPAVYAADGHTVLIPAHSVQFAEQGVAGPDIYDVYAAHDLIFNTSFPDIFGTGGTTSPDIRVSNVTAMGSPSLFADQLVAPAAVIGMPAMIGRYVNVDMTTMATDWFLNATIPDARPVSTATSHKVLLTRLVAAPTAGQIYPNDPLPSYADLPQVANFVSAEGKNTSTDTVLLDTGSQMSMISTATATKLGLRMNPNDPNTHISGYMPILGIGGTVMVPLVTLDHVVIPTKDGVDLVMTDVTVGVVDITGVGGIFGMNLLTSGWQNVLSDPNTIGYLDSALLDFTGSSDWEMELNIDPTFHVVQNGSYVRPARTIRWQGSDVREILINADTGDTQQIQDVTWNTSRAGQNWVDSVAPNTLQNLKYHDGDAVIFDDSAAAAWDPSSNPLSPFVIDIVAAVAPGSIVVNNSANDYTFTNVTGLGSITGTTGLTKQGTAKLIMQVSNNYTGLTDVQGGELVLAVPQNIGPVQVRSTARLTMQSSQHFAALTLSGGSASITPGGAKLLEVEQVTINGGSLDLANNAMVVHGGDLTAVNNLVKSGYNNGSWNGTGIITSSYHATQIDGNDKAPWTTLGVGQVGTDIVVKYTYQGDVDLNGVVNAADFAQIKYGSLNQVNGMIAGRPLAYSDGDVDYNGVINAADFAMTKSSSLNQGAPLGLSLAQIVAVPEPATLAVLALGAIAMLARRRRR